MGSPRHDRASTSQSRRNRCNVQVSLGFSKVDLLGFSLGAFVSQFFLAFKDWSSCLTRKSRIIARAGPPESVRTLFGDAEPVQRLDEPEDGDNRPGVALAMSSLMSIFGATTS